MTPARARVEHPCHAGTLELGLDAAVRCRCWEDGLCTPTRLAPHIYVDAASNILAIDLSWDLFEKEIREFDQWVESACAHPGMDQAGEWISNWPGVRCFQNALRTAGRDKFRTLLSEIPDNNGGLTSPEAARNCLKELEHFESLDTFGQHVELTDSEAGRVIATRVEAYDGWFATHGRTGYTFSLEADGCLQIGHDQLGIVFRSKEFEQVKEAEGRFVYTDLTTGVRCVCPDGLQDDETSEYPTKLKGVVGSDGAARYAHEIAALRRVFSAAIEVNHPVSWS